MRTITKVYDTYSHAQRVVHDLETAGVPTSDISVVANKYISDQYAGVEEVSSAATGATMGAAVGGGAGLLAGLGLLAIPGLGPVVAAGWLASTVAGAAAGAATGGIIGALVDTGVPEEHAHVYAESIRRGGTMVTARVADALASQASSIMDRFSPIDPASRMQEYRRDGWEKFDPQAPAYKPNESDLERIRRDYRG